jgi:HK97 family phage prohead protease
MMTSIDEAAQARSVQVRQRVHRPSQRRCAEYARSGARVGFRASMSLVRAAAEVDPRMQFLGVASATEQPYEMYDAFGPYNEVVSHGAFTQTLAQKNLDVPLVIGHDQIRRIARTTNGTLTLSATDAGLDVRADLDPSDPDVAYIAPKLSAGLLDEMSFGFRIDSGVWSPDYTEYRINAVDLHRGDVSIVGWGANPNTSGGLVTESAQTFAQASINAFNEAQVAFAKLPALIKTNGRSTGITRAAFDALYR